MRGLHGALLRHVLGAGLLATRHCGGVPRLRRREEGALVDVNWRSTGSWYVATVKHVHDGGACDDAVAGVLPALIY